MTLAIFSEIPAGAFVLWLFLLLAGTVGIIVLDALFKVSDESIIRIQNDLHEVPPILHCSDASPLQSDDPAKSWIPV